MRWRGREDYRAYSLYGGLALAVVGLVLTAALLTWSAAAQSAPSFPKSIYVYVFYPGVVASVDLDPASGGSGAITYSISPDIAATPANGLSLTASGLRLTGTPDAVAETVRYTLTATDGSGATATTTLSVTVIADVCGGVDTWRSIPQGVTVSEETIAHLVKDCNILLSAKDELRGTATLDPDWDTGTNMSTWEGVQLFGGFVRVFQLDLSSKSLDGSIPEQLGGLVNPVRFNLSRNQLTGAIPPELGGLVTLERLWLYDNQLDGEIPPELGNMSSLQELSLHTNQLSGGIPGPLGELGELNFLDLADNELAGRLPTELSGLDRLVNLSLHDNRLTGRIPAEFADTTKLTSLLSLSLYGNEWETPATLTVTPTDTDVTLPLSENDGPTEFMAQVEITDPGTLWASAFPDPDGGAEQNPLVASGEITATRSGRSPLVVVDISPAVADFSIAQGEKMSGVVAFTLTPVDDTEITDSETVTFRLTGTGAPWGTGTTLKANSIAVVIEDGDRPTGIELSVAPDSLAEDDGAKDLTLTVELVGGSPLADDTAVTLTYYGNAERNTDYTVTAGEVSLPAGQRSVVAVITIDPVDDGVEEGAEAIILSVSIRFRWRSYTRPDGQRYEIIEQVTKTVRIPITDPIYQTVPLTLWVGNEVVRFGPQFPSSLDTSDFTYEIIEGTSLPPGLSFETPNGVIKGAPTEANPEPTTVGIRACKPAEEAGEAAEC